MSIRQIRWNVSLYFIITGYGIRDTELGAVVTAYEPHTPDDFISALRESVTQIQTLIPHAYCIPHQV